MRRRRISAHQRRLVAATESALPRGYRRRQKKLEAKARRAGKPC